jgi:Undecaprenyl-phosphate glucose phosphotransferase
MNVSNVIDAEVRLRTTVAPKFLISPAMLPGLAYVLDAVAILLAAVAASVLWGGVSSAEGLRQEVCVLLTLAVYSLWGFAGSLYALTTISRPFGRTDGIVIALGAAALLYLAAAYGFGAENPLLQPWVWGFYGTSLAFLFAGRILGWRAFRKLGERGVIGRSLVVLGVGEQSRRFLSQLADTQPYFCNVVGVYECRRGESNGRLLFEGIPVMGDLDDLLNHARDHKTDDIVIAASWNAGGHVADAIDRLKELPVNVYLSTELTGFEFAFQPTLGYYRETPMFEVYQRPISGWSAALKALEDYVIAFCALVLIAPLLIMIAIAIKIDSSGPVFFMQERLGFNNKVFKIFKFRSMYHREEPEGVVKQAQRGDPRVTRVGRFIRATSLDELPQLLNVLNGTMSLVGPRPHAISHNQEYGTQIRGYFARHRVKPGITGWAQINGLRGETETLDKMVARIQHDIFYADNWSLLFDIRILFMTAFVVPFQKSAY